jgi:hypothetical protein
MQRWVELKTCLASSLAAGHRATALRKAIANQRKVRQLLRDWEIETERLIDAEQPTAN